MYFTRLIEIDVGRFRCMLFGAFIKTYWDGIYICLLNTCAPPSPLHATIDCVPRRFLEVICYEEAFVARY